MAPNSNQQRVEASNYDEKSRYEIVAGAIVGRRSIRRYHPRPVTLELIDSLLHVAISAPSAHNRQPWRFRVLTNDDEKITLARSMGKKLRCDRSADGDDAEIIEADASRSYIRITGAPAIIVICMSQEDMDRYPDPKRTQSEYTMAVQSVAMAGQNLLLAIHAAGLGACWLCAPLFCPDIVSAALKLPESWQPQGLITLGYPADVGKPFGRHALDKVCRPDNDGRSDGFQQAL
jgi:F420 biosynthesis protein FbiB-like protein